MPVPSELKSTVHILVEFTVLLFNSVQLRGKYFAVLPSSAQKQIFMDKIVVVKLPATHCICYDYELEISW